MQRIWEDHRLSIIVAAVVLIGLMMSLYIVPEEEQVVIVRTGEPQGIVNTPDGTKGPGPYLRVPFLDRVVPDHRSGSDGGTRRNHRRGALCA